MDNGERRIRLKASDGSAYIRTEAGDEGAWQNAHHHKGVQETYIVERGWIVYAELKAPGQYKIAACHPGEIFTSRVGIDHNVYVPPGAVIHTVQHGTPVGNPGKNGNDWYPADEIFDAWTKGLSQELLEKLPPESPASS